MDIIGELLHTVEDIATICKSEMAARQGLFIVAVQFLLVAGFAGPFTLIVDYVSHHQVRFEPICYQGEIEIVGANPKDRPPLADTVLFHHLGQVIGIIFFNG